MPTFAGHIPRSQARRTFSAIPLDLGQQIDHVSVECRSKLFDVVNADVAFRTLDAPKISTVESCQVREYFLRQPYSLATRTQI